MGWSADRVALLLAATATACAAAPRESPTSSPSVAASSAQTTTEREPPTEGAQPTTIAAVPATPALDAPASLITLDVAGFGPAIVGVPIGAISRRPVLIATHGNYDRPEWQCATWSPIVGRRGFVLCPRGIARRDSPTAVDRRWEYASNRTLEREVAAGIAALRARFPEFVDDGAAVYAGFSQGAIMGVAIALRAPAVFPRLVLTEGGFDTWTNQSAKAYRQGGGSRVLFACGQTGCAVSARQSVALLTRAGVDARVVAATGNGHSYGGAVAEAIGEAFGWLVADDARWAGE